MGTETEGHRALVVPVEGPVREVVLPVEPDEDEMWAAMHRLADADVVGHMSGPNIFTATGRVRIGLWIGTHEADTRRNQRVSFMLSTHPADEVRGPVIVTGHTTPRAEVVGLPAAAVEALLTRWAV